MSVSTEIATTDTGEPGGRPAAPQYVGRFAPSPTGDLHLGSLLAAVGSFLDARAHGGRWLVRMEDLDAQRVVPGSASGILRTLEHFGLNWDGAVLYQSTRLDHYRTALERLRRRGLTFECSCSRRNLGTGDEATYPGTCRSGPTRDGPTATRFRIDERLLVLFADRIQGNCSIDLGTLGDAVIRRKDGIPSYQLAVVVDDEAQGITDVVRGADLQSSTGWQIALQQALGWHTPNYAHLPLVVAKSGEKLAKSRQSVAINTAEGSGAVARVLHLLHLSVPGELRGAPAALLLDWAQQNWRPQALQGIATVADH